VRFGFIAKHRAVWLIRVMCAVLQVSPIGFYEWFGRAPSRRARANEKLTGLIRQRFEASDRTDGSRRVWRDLQAWGERCGIHRVERLMHAASLAARKKRRRVPNDTGVWPEHSIAPNLLQRAFEAEAPNRKWLADFTYVWTAEAGCMWPSCWTCTRAESSAGR
jgi:putative transposase